jgi:polyisoprenoid-binding protein YceI
MRRLNPTLIVIVVGMVASASGHADTILHATLTNAQENPPAVPTTSTDAPRPASFGTALFTLNDSRTTMSFTATIFNIDVTGKQTPDEPNDDLSAAHIHAGPAVTPLTNGPVVWGFFGEPFNDNNPPSPPPTMIPFATGVGGTFTGTWDEPEGNNTTLSAQLDNILSGRSYINFHTTQFGGGEIRGAIVQRSTPAVFQAAGLTASSIQSTVDAFRAELGEPNNANNPGPLASGRREINWDGGGNNFTTDTPVTPFNVFLNTRGAQFTTLGTGLAQGPPGGPQGGLAVLFNNPTYATIFSTFSQFRLFTPVGSNITQAQFFIPGTNGATPARVRGFGAVFTDVDEQPDGRGHDKKRGNREAGTLIKGFGPHGKLLFSRFVPASPGDGSLSFFGIVFDKPLIARVLIRTGDTAPGPDDDRKRDIVVMDDFIYGEPVPAQKHAKDFLSTEETAGSTAAQDESTTASTDESATSAAEESTTAAAPASQTLTVINGSASGDTPGSVVTVTANDPPAGQQFAGWTGDVEILANRALSPTTATIPSTPVTITATYVDASATQP